MKVLIIDTSTDYLYVRFYDDEKDMSIYSKEMVSHNNHSENLLTTIEEGLKDNNLKLKDFDKIVIGYGPGSYTGLRISMVVGKMASFSLKTPLYIISSLSFIGSGYFNEKGIFAITSVAKKGYSYSKIIEVSDRVKVLVDDEFISNTELDEKINKYNATLINQNNYKLSEKVICENAILVDNLHDLVPNYLRKANS